MPEYDGIQFTGQHYAVRQSEDLVVIAEATPWRSQPAGVVLNSIALVAAKISTPMSSQARNVGLIGVSTAAIHRSTRHEPSPGRAVGHHHGGRLTSSPRPCSRDASGWTWIDPAGHVLGLGRPVDVQGDRDRLLVTRAMPTVIAVPCVGYVPIPCSAVRL